MLRAAHDVLVGLGYTLKGNSAVPWLNGLGIPHDERVLILRSNVISYDVRNFPNRGLVFLKRAAVNRVAMKSNKPAAKDFQDWLANDVIPAIEDTGGYLLNEEARESAKADVRETVPVPEVVAELTATLIAEKTARHQAEIALLVAQQATLEAQSEREAVIRQAFAS